MIALLTYLCRVRMLVLHINAAIWWWGRSSYRRSKRQRRPPHRLTNSPIPVFEMFFDLLCIRAILIVFIIKFAWNRVKTVRGVALWKRGVALWKFHSHGGPMLTKTTKNIKIQKWTIWKIKPKQKKNYLEIWWLYSHLSAKFDINSFACYRKNGFYGRTTNGQTEWTETKTGNLFMTKLTACPTILVAYTSGWEVWQS